MSLPFSILYRKSVVFRFHCGKNHSGCLFTMKIAELKLPENLIQLDPGIYISTPVKNVKKSACWSMAWLTLCFRKNNTAAQGREKVVLKSDL